MFTFTKSGKFIRKDLELDYYEITRQEGNLSELPAFQFAYDIGTQVNLQIKAI